MAVTTPNVATGWHAPAFELKGVDDQWHSLASLAGSHGTLVVFICNHCPYVKAILPRLIRDARDLQALGVRTIAINSNDDQTYPEDSFEHMKRIAQEMDFPFPYLHDATQDVAKAYDAVCTPDYYGLDQHGALHYRGRLDASGREPGPADAPRELFEAMRMIALEGRGPQQQHSSIGCSIKWRDAA